MFKGHIAILTIVLAITILSITGTGCSSGTIQATTTPPDGDTSGQVPIADLSDTIPVGMSIPAVFGVYEVNIDPGNLTGEIHPLRGAGVLGDTYSVDITPFLTVSPCSDCLRMSSISMSGEYLDIDFQTKHPFKPENRYDLNVFDLRGIIVTGDNTRLFDRIPIDPDDDGVYDTVKGNVDFVVDPDGFTSFYDAVLEDYLGRPFDGNVNPYKCLWMNPATTSPGSNYDPKTDPDHGFNDLKAASGHNVFPMGGKFENALSTTTYRFDFSTVDSVSFLFVLEASYAHTALKADRLNPRYFLPEFNRKDAWKIQAEVFNNNLFANDWSSTAYLRIRALDWQGGKDPDPAWNYATSELTRTRYASDIREVLIDIPGILTNPIFESLSSLKSGDGSYTNPYTWEIGFANQMSAGSGKYWGIVAVRDELEGSANTPYGINGDLAHPIKLSDITTYQAFKVSINSAPVAELEDDEPDDVVYNGGEVNFKPGPGTYDPDGAITKYEYDFDFDGVNFTADVTQNQGSVGFGDPVTRQFTNPSANNIKVKVAFRVTDDGTPVLTAVTFNEFTVRAEVGVYLYEDFETTTGGSLPNGWGITGMINDAYYLGTNGGGCEDANWKWGVTVNAADGEPDQSHFLNEDGFIHTDADLMYTYQNRATIAYTPEFEVPAHGATLTLRHWFDFTIIDIGIARRYRDGGIPILSIENPGTSIDWEDFCDPEPESHHPKRSLPVISGPVGYEYVSPYAAGGHPLRGWTCHTGSSGAWITSTYLISNVYAGQVVRLGFLFGSDDLERDDLSDCDPRPLADARAGWRINWVSLQEN